MVANVQAISIVDAVALSIRNKLFDGSLGSEVQLTESSVASSYDVARPTAKAAIEKLVAEGLLVRGAHKTARVPAMGPNDVRDLYFSRLVIETEAVRRLAARRQIPAGLVMANDRLPEIGGSPTGVVVEPVVEFHMLLVNSMGSPRLSRLFSTLMGDMRLCMAQMQARRLMRPSVIAEEHRRIIAKIAAGNSDGAAQALAEHLTLAQDRLVPVLESQAPARLSAINDLALADGGSC